MTKKGKNEKDVEKEVIVVSKSSQIRDLYDQGEQISTIAQKVGVRYQFVYNVVSRYCNKTGQEVRHQKEKSTSQIIREKVDEGKKVGEIAKELNLNYVFVHQVVKKYREQKNE